jgi:hypothetical protein
MVEDFIRSHRLKREKRCRMTAADQRTEALEQLINDSAIQRCTGVPSSNLFNFQQIAAICVKATQGRLKHFDAFRRKPENLDQAISADGALVVRLAAGPRTKRTPRWRYGEATATVWRTQRPISLPST